MKIGLIYLPHPYLNQPDAQAPIGLLYIAAIIEDKFPDVDLEVFNMSSYSSQEEAIQDLSFCDLFGITITSLELPQANRFSKRLKKKFPECKIVLGGPGTSTPEFVDFDHVDSICKGEAENAIAGIVQDVMLCDEESGMKKIYEGVPPFNLDVYPYPARHLLKDKQGGNIFAYNKHFSGTESTVILSSRGCPFHCPFCSSMFISGALRFRSPENVYKEIKHVIDKYGITQFRFSDDMFTANIKRAMKICQLVKPLNISWRISTRVKPFSRQLAKTLFEAGCKEISFGVESFDNDVLKVLDKKTTAADNVEAIKIAKEAGMTVRILFMIKTPGQTSNTVTINIRYLENLKSYYDIIACTTFMPIPGSLIWKNPKKYKIEILSRDLDDYNFYFYWTYGEIPIKDVIKLYERDPEEVNRESQYFRDYLKLTGKINHG